LLLFAVELFQVRGWPRRIVGYASTVGYVISTGAAVPYVFLDPNPYNGVYMPYIQSGIILMVLGTATAIVALFASMKRSTKDASAYHNLSMPQ
jgi:hypothetical protein